jgi:hypothetical protein
VAITEVERLRLHQHFKESMGEEQAATLMQCLPPAGWGDVATKQDLAHLRDATKQDIARLRDATKQDIARLRDATKQDFAHLREWCDIKFDAVDTRFDSVATKEDVANLRAELHKVMRTQLFGFFVAASAAASLVRVFS